MKVVQINTVYGSGSTGKICAGISTALTDEKIENYVIYTLGNSSFPNGIKCKQALPKIQTLKSRILGNYGFNSVKTTNKMLEELEQLQPDIVHLHNLHGHNCNLEILMSYFKEKKMKVFWTFHDCWTFTAYCPYYDMEKCDKWKTGCHDCAQRKRYSWFFDRSAALYERKKHIFTGLDLTIITPSRWLSDQVKMSFLRECPVKVIHNGIDLDVFQPRVSQFRQTHHITEKKCILLGVASKWVPRKGADVFIRLAESLNPEKFQIVLVGTDDRVDKLLPKNIISIHRTENQIQLAEIYSAADLFVNPTREEVLGLVNLEALACGTPVITFCTGGSPECIDENTGTVVACDDEEALYQEILRIAEERPYSPEDCRKRALQFSEQEKYTQYYMLYKQSLAK